METTWPRLRSVAARIQDALTRWLALRIAAEVLLPFAIFATVVLRLYGPALGSSYNVEDEWRIARFYAETVSSPTTGIATFARLTSVLIQYDLDTSLFRPVYDSILVAEVVVFGQNLYLWHLTTLLAAILVSLILFRAARNVGAAYIAAIMLGLWLVVTGPEGAAVWVQLGPTGWTGMLLGAVAIWAVTKSAKAQGPSRWDALAIACLLLAGWTKESYILIAPPIMIGRLALHKIKNKGSWVRSLKTLRVPVIVSAAICILQVIVVLLMLRPGGYGTKFIETSDMIATMSTWPGRLGEIAYIAAYYVPFFAGLIAIGGVEKDSQWHVGFITASAIGLIWLLPQIVLFKARLFERYAYPALIGFVGLNVLGLSLLWSRRLWVGVLLCLVISLVGLGISFQEGSYTASSYRATTVSLDRLQSCLQEQSPRGKAVVIALEGKKVFPHIFLIEARYLVEGVPSPIYLSTSLGRDDPEKTRQSLIDDITPRPFDGGLSADDLATDQVGAIVLLEPRADFAAAAPGWYHNDGWYVQKFTEPVFNLPLIGRPAQTDQVRYNILLPLKPGISAEDYQQVCASADPS